MATAPPIYSLRQDPSPKTGNWPEGCRYFEPGLMDAKGITAILEEDTRYVSKHCSWQMAYTTVTSEAVSTYHTSGVEGHNLFSRTVADCPLVVIHVGWDRHYFTTSSSCAICLDKITWHRLLSHFDILPSFLNLLQNNNGGSLSHTSFAQSIGSRQQDSGTDISALHLAYKMGSGAEQELAIYARVDVVSGRCIVLVVGTRSALAVDQVHRLLETNSGAGWLHVVHHLLAVKFAKVESLREHVDLFTRQHEDSTGYAAFTDSTAPLNVRDLKFDRLLYVTSDLCRDVAYGARRLRLNCEAFINHLDGYSAIISGNGVYPCSLYQVKNLREACVMIVEQLKHQLDQIGNLRLRLLAQADVKKSLIAQRDTQLTLDISEATKRDSELMRGITAITMVFLPATFVATFFSMVFFHVGEETTTILSVNANIWMYPVVAVPLTLAITAWYLAWASGCGRRRVRDVFVQANMLNPVISAKPVKSLHVRTNLMRYTYPQVEAFAASSTSADEVHAQGYDRSGEA